MSKLVKHDRVCLRPPYFPHKREEKPTEAPSDASGASSSKMEEAARELSAGIIEKARKNAAKIAEEAEEKAKGIYKKAFDDGYADGYQSGREQAAREAKEELDRIKRLFAQIDARQAEMIKDNERNILKLAVKIAEKIVNRALTQDDEVFVKMFAGAVEGMFGQKLVKLTVSGHEASFATANSSYLLGLVRDAEQIEVFVDEKAPKGTCIIETESAIVDASASTQLKSMEKALLEK